MDEGIVFGRGISFPPRVGPDGRVAWSSGPANVAEAIRVILLTDPGERVLLPEFGSRLNQYLDDTNSVGTRRLIADEIMTALKRWEARLQLQSVEVQPDPDDDRAAIATIRYALVANRAPEQVSVRIQLAG